MIRKNIISFLKNKKKNMKAKLKIKKLNMNHFIGKRRSDCVFVKKLTFLKIYQLKWFKVVRELLMRYKNYYNLLFLKKSFNRLICKKSFLNEN